ncbi:MAG: exodeoxyribonuclease VII small subunit [Mariniblastus sp.]|nr:exodeoxyribonuclease VII small subunit [Mariniblastus sp.]
MAKKKTARKTKSQPASIPFEQSFQQLQEIVTQLEQGHLTLDDSLKKYEQGIQHLRNCYSALDQAERKIELLVELDDQGRMVTRHFDGNPAESESGEEEVDPSDSGLF